MPWASCTRSSTPHQNTWVRQLPIRPRNLGRCWTLPAPRNRLPPRLAENTQSWEVQPLYCPNWAPRVHRPSSFCEKSAHQTALGLVAGQESVRLQRWVLAAAGQESVHLQSLFLDAAGQESVHLQSLCLAAAGQESVRLQSFVGLRNLLIFPIPSAASFDSKPWMFVLQPSTAETSAKNCPNLTLTDVWLPAQLPALEMHPFAVALAVALALQLSLVGLGLLLEAWLL
jgi:hypothetical protein